MALLSVKEIGKQERDAYAVRHVSFEQQPFQKIAIAGETGSGKSTLLKMIAGLVQPDEGQVLFEGQRVRGPLEKLIPGHPRIAYLSQHFELRNNYRVEEELESKNLLTEEEAQQLYKVCQITHLLKRKTNQLSGGERQRIVLARLLTTAPSLLLLDEPFSNLDAVHKRIIKTVLQDIALHLKISCILVSHDAADLLPWADTILVLQHGKIIQQGNPEQIYHQPINEYCAGLFGEYNLLNTSSIERVGLPVGKETAAKQLLLRPDDMQIVDAGNSSFSGTVQQVLFRGGYYTVEVMVNEQMLQVRTVRNNFSVGETIYLTITRTDNWYV